MIISEIGQDLFVLEQTKLKRNGFFVEFGATNGKWYSNTYLLEKDFGWTGILCEAIPALYVQCKENRQNSIVESKCVWTITGEKLKFRQVAKYTGLSTIKAFMDNDCLALVRQFGIDYDVETISLLDLLDKHNAPKIIDYLSIDTEGSEFTILNAFDFNKYQINIITCEHNYVTSSRQSVLELLTSKGYTRVHQDRSQHDDWYIRSNIDKGL
jgi:FkbM family methyltransferase